MTEYLQLLNNFWTNQVKLDHFPCGPWRPLQAQGVKATGLNHVGENSNKLNRSSFLCGNKFQTGPKIHSVFPQKNSFILLICDFERQQIWGRGLFRGPHILVGGACPQHHTSVKRLYFVLIKCGSTSWRQKHDPGNGVKFPSHISSSSYLIYPLSFLSLWILPPPSPSAGFHVNKNLFLDPFSPFFFVSSFFCFLAEPITPSSSSHLVWRNSLIIMWSESPCHYCDTMATIKRHKGKKAMRFEEAACCSHKVFISAPRGTRRPFKSKTVFTEPDLQTVTFSYYRSFSAVYWDQRCLFSLTCVSSAGGGWSVVVLPPPPPWVQANLLD